MLRIIRWSFLAAYLIVVGLWSAAAAPVALLATGVAVILTAVPMPVWLLATGATLLALNRQQPTPTIQPAD
ncbi:hypothetical protein ACGFZR_15225 [Streptomyces sp. NPDC048241]|uniref:hypothetical protein n=1 Tax=Streptomyces sp. NPDC048241 TaxID=3365521 RepID=UPI00371F7804